MFGKISKIWNGLFYQSVDKYEKDVKTVKFVNVSPNADPQYAHDGDSGFDLRAWIGEFDEGAKVDGNGQYTLTLKSLERRLIHTGIYLELPEYTEAQVRPRSGMALKQGLSVLNTPGTVDNKYVGEVGVIAVNLSKKPITITNGDRIAQLTIMPVYLKELINLVKVEEVSETERGSKGFGSSGVK